MQETICLNCGQKFVGENKFCSRQCRYAYHASQRRGKPRPDMIGRAPWNKGLSAENDERVADVANKRLKNVVDEVTLHELYVVRGMTLREIGSKYGVSKQVIKRLVTEHGFQRQRDQLTVEMLRDLYNVQKLSAGQIAERYDCTNTYVLGLLKGHGIQRRKNTNQSRIEPSAELLRSLYWDEWLSYEKIADRLGVDLTSIPYWLKKFGIPKRGIWETRRGKDWQEPDIETIKHLYLSQRLSTKTIGEILNAPGSYIGRLLKQAGVELRRAGYPNVSHYTAKDGHRVKSGLEVRVDDWLFEHGIAHTYEPRIGNTQYFGDFLVDDVFVEIWGIHNNARYNQKMSTKLKAYSVLDLKLISIYQSDFPELKPLHVFLRE